MTIQACQSTTTNTRIAIEENGKKATFINESRREFVKTQIDNCVIREGRRADWIVSIKDVGCVIVELKGRGVEHAANQILETAKFWIKDNNLNCAKLAALIVSAQYPKFSPGIQKLKIEFTRSFKGPLHVVTANYEFIFENLFKFNGILSRMNGDEATQDISTPKSSSCDENGAPKRTHHKAKRRVPVPDLRR